MSAGRIVSVEIHGDHLKLVAEVGGRWFTALVDDFPPDLAAPFATPGAKWEELPVVVETFFAPERMVPIVGAEPIFWERPSFIYVDGEKVRVARCEDCCERVAVNFNDGDEPYGVPTKCDDCSTACGSDCCGWLEHTDAGEIRAEAKRRGWPT